VPRGEASSTLPAATPPPKNAKKKTDAASPLFSDHAEMSPEPRPAPETPEPNGVRTSLGADVVKLGLPTDPPPVARARSPSFDAA